MSDADLPVLPSFTDDLIVAAALGEGATAGVFRAWMSEAGQWCAVKVMKDGLPLRTRQRFVDEARLLRGLSHRNLIKVLRVEDGPPPWFVMEIADGGSLKDWCARYGKMPPRLAVDAAIQICKGVAVAHQAGVIHRDIKPHNVLINRSGACKLTDFGIARFSRKVVEAAGMDPTLRPDTVDTVGTLGYMAPEQHADPTGVDEGADLYAIGATLFHLLLGVTPPGNLFMAAREHPELLAAIPEVLAPVLLKATAYKRADRQASAMDLARELHATWEFLPPLARDAPTLTAGIPLEPDPPPGMIKRTPNTASSTDRSALPALDEVALSTRAPPSAPPSLTPRPSPRTDTITTPRTEVPAFRRTAPAAPPRTEPPPAPPSGWLRRAALAALVPVALLGLDLWWVASARQASLAAQGAFLEAARANSAVIDELGSLGADRAALTAAYDALRAGSVRQRHAAARAWVDTVSSAVAAGDPRRAAVIRSRQDTLEAALAPWTVALATWDRRDREMPGALVSPLVGGPDTATGDGR